MCYSRERLWIRCHAEETLRFLPQDFHNCGKHCGKHHLAERIRRFALVFALLSVLFSKAQLTVTSVSVPTAVAEGFAHGVFGETVIRGVVLEITAMESSIWDQVLARVETKVNRHS